MSSPASTTPSLSPTDAGGEPTGGAPHGANYFFGFLITFVGLLIIFIICGIGSRRRLARTRRLNDTLEPLGHWRKLEGEETRPQFYEPPLVIGKDRWNSLMVRIQVLTGGHEAYLLRFSSRYLSDFAEKKRAIQLIVICDHYRQPQISHVPDLIYFLHSICSTTTTKILHWKLRPILNHQTLCKSPS